MFLHVRWWNFRHSKGKHLECKLGARGLALRPHSETGDKSRHLSSSAAAQEP